GGVAAGLRAAGGAGRRLRRAGGDGARSGRRLGDGPLPAAQGAGAGLLPRLRALPGAARGSRAGAPPDLRARPRLRPLRGPAGGGARPGGGAASMSPSSAPEGRRHVAWGVSPRRDPPRFIPKPRRGDGSSEWWRSAVAPSGLSELNPAPFLGLTPQATCRRPSGAGLARSLS